MAGPPHPSSISRRSLLGGAVGLGAAMAGGVFGCGTRTSISEDPNELVLWYWNRSISQSLLAKASKRIPGTTKRLRADAIGTTFDAKLRTSLAGGSYIPDIAAINSTNALYFPNEDMFLDLNELGAERYRTRYFDWKWKLGVTPSDRQCFWPMDIGPTGFFYRKDILDRAKVPSEPEEVTAAVATWDGYFELGAKVKRNAGAFLDTHAEVLFLARLNASPQRYFDAEDRPIFAEHDGAVRSSWDVAVRGIREGITANLQIDPDRNAAWINGRVCGHIEGSWWQAVLADTAPDTKGRWRIASQPVRAGNSGGSFLTLPATCKDPQAGFAFIQWLTNPANQAVAFNELQLYPSAPEAITGGRLKDPFQFFGSQDPQLFFLEAAKQVPTAYVSGWESQTSAFTDQLKNVENGKDSEQAWQDAVDQSMRRLRKRDVVA